MTGPSDVFPRRTRSTAAFERRVGTALGAHVASDSTLLVACSGGPDSAAALVAVARLLQAAGGQAVAAHFNHGMRAEAETAADLAYVEWLADCLGVRVLSGLAAEDGSMSEADAREARYRWLATAAREAGATACVTGHTLDDQAETVLLRLARGTGLAGAAGMDLDTPWPVACDAAGGDAPLRVLRPLLGVARVDVAVYLEALGLAGEERAPRHDASNDDLSFSRNRVRHRVLPELEALNHRAAEALARFAAHARRDDAALEAWAAREAAALMRIERAAVRIERRHLAELPEAVALRLVRRAAKAAGLSVDADQAEGVLGIAGRRGARLDVGGGSVWTDADAVWFGATRRDGPPQAT
ncbi:MAG: tRNA lysidine(34) synthetase TilS [Chloroflexi bacterium]|nr:tRNA lysidine(34) synthetase TilS [Chloroflexota bacterium]